MAMRLITPWPLLKEIRGRRQPRLAKVPEGRHHVHRRRRGAGSGGEARAGRELLGRFVPCGFYID